HHDNGMKRELEECCRYEQLCNALTKAHRQTQLQKVKIIQKKESRRLISEQLIAAEDILSSVGERMSVRYSSQLTDGIERRLDKYGYYCDSVAAYYNDRERLMIEFYCQDRQLEGCMTSVCHILTEMLNIELEELEPVGTKDSVRYRLCQSPPFMLRKGSAARCAESGEISGDTTVLFRDGDGCAYAVLSDGMGTGKEAAVESKMTAEMFRKLVSSGVSCDSALRIINGIMLTKSEQESFATFDAARFDLDSGEMTLIKSGASSTLLRQGSKVVRVCAPTFPIGAGASPDVFVRRFSLHSNDMIVMLSDGVTESQYPFIKELLMKSDDPVYVAEEICRKAVIFGGGRCRDDISVTVIQILGKESVGT
ncbi:MAG: SpoIIE family protein phosphatase, partial [Oscillospiraceae bacterium]|nr:SpoIIE family protein phosphatase [Oscillospiraceae bacterium]